MKRMQKVDFVGDVEGIYEVNVEDRMEVVERGNIQTHAQNAILRTKCKGMVW